MTNRLLALVLLFLAGPPVLACGGDEQPPQRRSLGSDAPAERQGLEPVTAARIDSGNAAYRAGDYEEASRHFRAATEAQPEARAAWFGVYMAERALGNEEAAEAALERSGDLPHPGGFLHAPPGAADTGADTAAGDG